MGGFEKDIPSSLWCNGCAKKYLRTQRTLHKESVKQESVDSVGGSFASATTNFSSQPYHIIFIFLPVSEEVPPDAADAEPDDDVQERNAEANRPPGLLVDIAGTEVDRCRARAEMREAAADVRCHGDDERGDECRCASGSAERDERGVHARDMRAHACEEVVAVEVDDEREDDCRNHADADHLIFKDVREPRDEAEAVEVVTHDDDAANPD